MSITTTIPIEPIRRLSPRACRTLHIVASGWSLVMIGVLAISSRHELLNAKPGGTAFELKARPLLMIAFALGALLSWRWEILGGVVAAFAAASLSAFAVGQLEAPSAMIVLAGFAVPGALWLVIELHDQRPRVAIAGIALIAVVGLIGALLSRDTFNDLYGPSHPSSTTPSLPDSQLEWIWSGGVTTTAASVVAKLADEAASARLLVSSDPSLRQPIASAPANPDEHRIVRLSIGGLSPSTTYHYAVEVDGRLDMVRSGTFRTFADGPQSFVVAAGGCSRVGSNGAVFDAIRSLDPDLFVINGDWNYANLTEDDAGAFREINDFTLSRNAQAALYRSTATAYIWDDHDYGGNDADAQSPTRAAAMSVYREYVPHYDLAGDDSPIYQAFTVGRVRFIMTDTRAARTASSAIDDERKTMLGAAQKEWFKRELLAAERDHALTVWVNASPWIGDRSLDGDGWAAYSTERRELADFIADNDIDSLMMLSGDAHMVAIDDGSNTDYSTSGGAGFPLLHAAALDRPGKVKGGPYSEGVVAGGGQFGVIEIDDNGADVQVRLTGRNWRNEVLLSYQFSVPSGGSRA